MSFWECPKCGGIPGVSFCCTSVDENQSSKVTMPEPVAHAVKAANTGKICSLYTAGDDAAFSGVYLMEKKHVDDLITTDQAEAYAEARVRWRRVCDLTIDTKGAIGKYNCTCWPQFTNI